MAVSGRAVLVMGPSGAGKSSLCLRMLALGARLVSDDRTALRRGAAGLLAFCPGPAIRGLIEARGIGLLRAEPLDEAPVALVIDLGTVETDRLPPRRQINLLGMTLPLLRKPQIDPVAEALMLYLQGDRQE
ncbi:HPr kinase/phosphorylase [Fuscovulum blasticum]|uniref:HPr kinase/phosphorylase n=1 Tax=Fuscovulum blasticum TaxID=1075 RepID=UPI001D17D292|nr:serine kinase [Fuscovulum blasticum]